MTAKEKKAVTKAIETYNYWVEHNMIIDKWENVDYDNTMNYENINGDVVAVERDENGNIIYAWEN